MDNKYKEGVSNYLKQSEEIQKLIKFYLDTDNYAMEYHEISRSEFLHTYSLRLKILESQGNLIHEKASRLKSLIQNFKNSSDEKILCVGINNYKLSIFCNVFLTIVYGYSI